MRAQNNYEQQHIINHIKSAVNQLNNLIISAAQNNIKIAVGVRSEDLGKGASLNLLQLEAAKRESF